MTKDDILNMSTFEQIDLYQSLPPELKMRWELLFDCDCHIPYHYCDYINPLEHSKNCPMYDTRNPKYNYL